MIHLKEQYQKAAIPKFISEHAYRNPLAVPKIEKVVVASGVGTAAQDEKQLDEVAATIALVTGQKPAVRRAKKAIASFKVRKGAPIGLMVTLRGKRMYDFLNRLVNATLPRMRDFRGLARSGFDREGNYTFGIREQIVFPEVSAEKIQNLHGMQVTIRTSAKNPAEGYTLLEQLGFPFQKEA